MMASTGCERNKEGRKRTQIKTTSEYLQGMIEDRVEDSQAGLEAPNIEDREEGSKEIIEYQEDKVGEEYFLHSLKAFDMSHKLVCPMGFIPVPGDKELGTKDFCVMQFEAKAWNDKNKDGKLSPSEIKANGCNGWGSWCFWGSQDWGLNKHTPVSVPWGKPWRKISRDYAMRECEELDEFFYIRESSGMKFGLLSNREWQTIARNIERVGENWSTGKVGLGCLNQGNAGEEGECSYNGGNPEKGDDPRAIHILSSGESFHSIYHFSGNVWEWVSDDNNRSRGEDQFISQISSVGDQDLKYDYGPSRNYICDDSNWYCGLGYGWLDGSAGAIVRGGYWHVDLLSGFLSAGVFAVDLKSGPLNSFFPVGFRCVLRFL